MEPAVADGGGGVGGVHDVEVASLLADQSDAVAESVDHVSNRFAALAWSPYSPRRFLWGASFPLAIAAVMGPGQDAGRVVGRVYAANTVGAIIGSVLFSVLIIPHFGTQQAERLLIATAILSAIVVFASMMRPAVADRRSATRDRSAPRDRTTAGDRRQRSPLRSSCSRPCRRFPTD